MSGVVVRFNEAPRSERGVDEGGRRAQQGAPEADEVTLVKDPLLYLRTGIKGMEDSISAMLLQIALHVVPCFDTMDDERQFALHCHVDLRAKYPLLLRQVGVSGIKAAFSDGADAW